MLSSNSAVGGCRSPSISVDLAADHAIHGAAAERKFVDKRDFARRVQAFDADEGLHGEREQSVARENRHGFAEDFVAGGFAAAEIVVIEGGKIVVDQRIRVDHFERASGFDGAWSIDPQWRRRPAGRGSDGCACRPRTGCSAWRGGWLREASDSAGVRRSSAASMRCVSSARNSLRVIIFRDGTARAGTRPLCG